MESSPNDAEKQPEDSDEELTPEEIRDFLGFPKKEDVIPI